MTNIKAKKKTERKEENLNVLEIIQKYLMESIVKI